MHRKPSGFTLIELSIVLVIIGLLVGGVLAGQDLIRGAAERAQITQIEKFNTAANTFYGKYGYLPGDIPAGPAAQFGLTPRGTYAGQGDGNGLLEGNSNNTASGNSPSVLDDGETGLFWVDLTYANGKSLNLIEGKFSSATIYANGFTSGSALANYYPAAKIGQGNYIYVTSAGATQSAGKNYFGIAAIASSDGQIDANPGLTVKQAYDIDAKVDDGLPESGNVTADYLNHVGGYDWQMWAGQTTYSPAVVSTSATAGSSTTCFDNSNAAGGAPGVAGAAQHYSLEISSGASVNCALTVKMQAGD